MENGFQVTGGSTYRLDAALKSIKKLDWGSKYNIYAILARVHNLETLRQNKSNFFSRITEDDEQTDPLVILLSEKYPCGARVTYGHLFEKATLL